MGIFGVFKNKKQLQKEREEKAKESIVNFACDNLLTEGKDYTVEARVDGVVLVKKVARFAELNITLESPYAMFSIETDKGLYCFQLVGGNLSMIQNDVMLSVYPQLAPEGYDLPKEEFEFVPNDENQTGEQSNIKK